MELDAFLTKVGTTLQELQTGESIVWFAKRINDEDCRIVAYLIVIGAMANCRGLSLANCRGIGDKGLEALSGALATGAMALTVLHLAGNQITDDGFATLLPLMQKDGKLSNLTEFSIGSGITDKGMTDFANFLATGALPALTVLGLGGNKIGDPGVTALAEACAKGALASVTILNLQRNQIGDQGIIKFSEALACGVMAGVRVLSLVGNQIGDAGVEALSSALACGAMASLRTLYMDGKSFGEAAKAQLAAACIARSISGMGF